MKCAFYVGRCLCAFWEELLRSWTFEEAQGIYPLWFVFNLDFLSIGVRSIKRIAWMGNSSFVWCNGLKGLSGTLLLFKCAIFHILIIIRIAVFSFCWISWRVSKLSKTVVKRYDILENHGSRESIKRESMIWLWTGSCRFPRGLPWRKTTGCACQKKASWLCPGINVRKHNTCRGYCQSFL